MRTNGHMYVPGGHRILVAQRGHRTQRPAPLINERAVRPVARDEVASPGSAGNRRPVPKARGGAGAVPATYVRTGADVSQTDYDRRLAQSGIGPGFHALEPGPARASIAILDGVQGRPCVPAMLDYSC